jgi:hypothetical protein
MILQVALGGHAKAAEFVEAGGFPGLRDEGIGNRNTDADESGNDGDDDENLDEGEAAMFHGH